MLKMSKWLQLQWHAGFLISLLCCVSSLCTLIVRNYKSLKYLFVGIVAQIVHVGKVAII